VADPTLILRCSRARDTSKVHLAVDVYQPMAALMAVLQTCSCGAETTLEVRSDLRRASGKAPRG
jgi:hypothetical protein